MFLAVDAVVHMWSAEVDDQAGVLALDLAMVLCSLMIPNTNSPLRCDVVVEARLEFCARLVLRQLVHADRIVVALRT